MSTRERLIDFVPRHHRGVGNWSGHQSFAYAIVAEMRPSRFVELGTHYGESYFTFCQSVVDHDVSSECFAVDTWRGDSQTGYYGDDVHGVVEEHNTRHYSAFSKLLRMTFDEAVGRFEDESIDLLHIDGLHTYDAVKADFDSWFPKVRPGGVVLFHDTVVRERDFGVWKLWDELAARYPAFQFTHSHGLGVIRKPGGADSAAATVDALLSQPTGTTTIPVSDYFYLLGQNVRLRQVEGDTPDSLISLSRAMAKTARVKGKLRTMRAIAGVATLVAIGLLVRALLG